MYMKFPNKTKKIEVGRKLNTLKKTMWIVNVGVHNEMVTWFMQEDIIAFKHLMH